MKKVLIVTYYWPPAGGPGVQRWLKFVKYLPENGVQPVLYLPEDPHYPITDSSLTEEVPDGLSVYRKPIWEPYRWASGLSKKKTRQISSGILPSSNPSFLDKFLLWVRGNLFIPDARKFWVGPSIEFLSGILEKEGIDIVITSGPPHSMHLIGMGLKTSRKIKWIADFRDPWTSIGYHSALYLGKWARKRHKELEKKVLNAADEILVTSRTTGDEFSKLTKKPITLITNGYDEMQDAEVGLDPYFSISHIGSLLSERNPKVLWKVLSELSNEIGEFRKALRIRLIGVVSDEIVREIQKYGLGDVLKVSSYLPHREAVIAQRMSRVLLLVEINAERTRGIIPGKLFEYMAARRPILAIGPEAWEAGTLVQNTGSGSVFTYSMEKELKLTLVKWFEDYKMGSDRVADQTIDEFSRRALTEKLAKRILWE